MTSVSEQSTSARTDMVRSGFALALSSTILTVSGFAFWVVVGFRLEDRALGDVAGLTSLIMFIAGVTQLNMTASLPAMLPGSGRMGRTVLARSYTTSVSLGVAVAVLVVIGLETLGGGVRGLDGVGLWLIPISVAAWGVFSIQDGALVGTGQARFVAIENSAYSVVRLLAAIAMMALIPGVSGALAAWFLPLILFIPLINIALWRLLDGPSKPDWTEDGFSQLVASDFFGSLAVMASTRGFAYLALAVIPSDDGADLAVAWLFFITVDVVFMQAANALTAEAARSPEHRHSLTRSAAALTSALGLVGGLIGVVAAPLLLEVLIDEPTLQLTTSLRLIFLALMARPVLHVWLARARAGRNHRELTLGPLIAMGVFIVFVTPGLASGDIVITTGGVALSQWIMTIAAWVALQFGQDAEPEDASLDLLPVEPQLRTAPVERKIGAHDIDQPRSGAHDLERPLKLSRTRFDITLPQRTMQFTRDELRIASDRGLDVRYGWAFVAVAVALLAFSVPRVDYTAVNGLGLLPALPQVFWLSVLCTTLAFVVFIVARHRAGSISTVALLILSLHGINPMSAPAARFSVAWLISGFSDVIAGSGSPARLIDARFSWPGFYLGPAAAFSDNDAASPVDGSGEFTAEAQQLPDVDLLIRYWPLAIFAVWVLLLWVLVRHWFPDRWIAAPIAAWLFTLTAWTGQNYFSPQSMGTTVTAMLVVFIALTERDERRDVSLLTRIGWLFLPGSGGQNQPRQVALTVMILIMVVTLVGTHPLSPVFLGLWLAPLAFAGYRYARGLPLVVFVIFITWLSGAARPWWRSRIVSLLDDVGAVGASVSEGTTARSADASIERSVVLLSRSGIVVAVAAFTLLAAGYLWRQRGQRAGALLLGMAGAPGLAIAGQPYGGEILVRVFLFSVFPAAILLGAALATISSRRLLGGSLLALTLLGAPTLIINRYGNESFEMTTASDRQALEAVYSEAPHDTLFLTDDPFISWGYTRLERIDGYRNHQYLRRLTADEDTILRAAEAGRAAGYDFVAVITANSQEAWGEQAAGRPDGWLGDVAGYLESHEHVETLYRDGTSGAFLIQVNRIDLGEETDE